MNTIDKKYTDLLQDILDNGVTKQDRTGTGTLSVFGRQIRHKMSEGFPLLTTKKMYFKGIVTELLWFLRGDTNIKFLVDNDCHIWDGDAYKAFKSKQYPHSSGLNEFDMEDFIIAIKNDDYKEYNLGELGPIYGKQWRSWDSYNFVDDEVHTIKIDQIANLINDLKTNPDSRRLMVNAWNVGELDQMVLPPCHYGFQVYTRELSIEERITISTGTLITGKIVDEDVIDSWEQHCKKDNTPTRAISLMWNQRSVDSFLGLPFNIASYGLLLEIIAKEVNMVPDELIGNLGDTHLYLNHIEQAKEQIGRDLSLEERNEIHKNLAEHMRYRIDKLDLLKKIDYSGGLITHEILDELDVPKRKRQPFPLPKLIICDDTTRTDSFKVPFDELEYSLIKIVDYQSHPTIKAPLSN
jgi:thymidylate synthase